MAGRRLRHLVSSEYWKASAHYKHGVSSCLVFLTTSTILWYTTVDIPALPSPSQACIWPSGCSKLRLCCRVRRSDEELWMLWKVMYGIAFLSNCNGPWIISCRDEVRSEPWKMDANQAHSFPIHDSHFFQCLVRLGARPAVFNIH